MAIRVSWLALSVSGTRLLLLRFNFVLELVHKLGQIAPLIDQRFKVGTLRRVKFRKMLAGVLQKFVERH